MIKEKIKQILIEDIREIKDIEDVKYALIRLVNSIPTTELIAENIVKAIDKELKVSK